MARFEVTGPDGGRYEINAPDGASEQEVMAYVQKNAASQPAGAGKFAAPQMAPSVAEFDSPRRRADREVADQDVGPKPLAFGIPIIGPYLDEASAAVASVPNKLFGVGPTYERSLERIRARNRKAERDYPIQDPAGQLAAGIVTGGPVLSKVPVAASRVGRMLQGAGLGGAIGAVQGFGAGEGDVESRLGTAAEQGAFGAGVGAVAPPVIEAVGAGVGAVGNVLSPTFARWGQNLRNVRGAQMPDEMAPRSLSAAAVPNPPPPGSGIPRITGDDAAADQMIANQLARANLNTTDVRQRLALARQANEIAPGQPIPSAMALVDVDPSLQRLAGSVNRQQPQAGNIARQFISGRQTGITPREGMPPNAGVPTRGMMDAPRLGTPAGQSERVRQALRDAFDVPPQTAYRTDQVLIETARRQSTPAYRQAYDAARGVDMTPTIEPLLQTWRASLVDQVDNVLRGRVSAAIGTVQRSLAPGGRASHFERLDSAKKAIDEMIDRASRSADRRSPNLVRILTGMKRNLVDAMDAVPNAGPLYRNARGVFGDTAQMREAIELGRGALREGTEVSIDTYNALSPGQQQLFRLGMLADLDQRLAATRRGNDVTLIFDSPRVQELLRAVMPPDRAQQFGRFLQTEKGFISTRNEVLGNSKTAERLADDQSFEKMSSLVEQLRSTRTIRDAAFNTVRAALDRMFGFRADTAEAIARRLFTADQRELDQIIIRLEQRLGPTRADQFRRLLQEHVSARAGAAAVVPQQQQQQAPPPTTLPNATDTRPMPPNR